MKKVIYDPQGVEVEIEFEPSTCTHPVDFLVEHGRAAYEGEPHYQTGWERYWECGLCGVEVDFPRPAAEDSPSPDEIPF